MKVDGVNDGEGDANAKGENVTENDASDSGRNFLEAISAGIVHNPSFAPSAFGLYTGTESVDSESRPIIVLFTASEKSGMDETNKICRYRPTKGQISRCSAFKRSRSLSFSGAVRKYKS